MTKFTSEEKLIIEESRADWNNQCKSFMQGRPFRDRTAKDCYKRHLKEAKEV